MQMFNLVWGNALLNEKYCWVAIFMMSIHQTGKFSLQWTFLEVIEALFEVSQVLLHYIQIYLKTWQK